MNLGRRFWGGEEFHGKSRARRSGGGGLAVNVGGRRCRDQERDHFSGVDSSVGRAVNQGKEGRKNLEREKMQREIKKKVSKGGKEVGEGRRGVGI